ncbi:hypothetical protein H072_64 [Dactylellina haptotyla CBS 200.50]|uniref:Uncharacterized protein n=1 Tax=Dactylellina haptotyla (strain CBS 200.50) TaxID=1284197 RepID=S8C2M4_DACHA|nr:hypothetical protein H072_64 [Dactylellina haptotyla CBS 200.50]
MYKPLVYVQNDLLDLGIDNTPHIIRIDGYEVEAWLAEFADFGNSQSPDARYNSIFSNRDPGSDGAFYSLWGWYPGKNYIDITFSNSSTVQYPYRAFARWNDILNWTGIADGRDFYNTIVLNPDYIPVETDSIISEPVPTSTAGPDYGNAHHIHDKRATRTRSMRVGTVTSSTRPSSTPTGDVQLIYFNAPFMRHRVGPFVQDLNAIVGGYFLNDTLGTAVIDISSFAAEDENALYQMPGFQQALYAFFDEVRRRESKKLIIDVRGNGGGIIALGFELYKQLFPAAPANSYYRFRAHEAAQIFAATAEAVATDNATEAQMRLIDTQGFEAVDDPASRAIRRAVNSGFSRQNVLDVRGNKPEDLKTFIGPYSLRGAVNDSVSLLVETNLNFSFGDADISGFGVLANFTDTPQPFAIPDILLLSDGTCASTCTIFAELLKREQANISTIVMGGRPNDSPSPHVGGVHGSRVLSYANLLQDTIDVVNIAPPENDEDAKYFAENLPLSLPFGFSYANINFRDAIRPEDPTQTPLQFILEPADCRLYFSPIGYSDSIYLWGELSEFKWGTRSNFTGCAVGGLQKGQASTGEVPPDPETMDIVNWITQGLNP